MKLKNLLNDLPCRITYRTYGPNNEDLFQGACVWNGQELKSSDGDIYSIDDDIIKYELEPSGDITIWRESKWVSE